MMMLLIEILEYDDDDDVADQKVKVLLMMMLLIDEDQSIDDDVFDQIVVAPEIEDLDYMLKDVKKDSYDFQMYHPDDVKDYLSPSPAVVVDVVVEYASR